MYWVEDSPAADKRSGLVKDFDHVVFADFMLCPTIPYVSGSMQGTTIQDFHHVRVYPR